MKQAPTISRYDIITWINSLIRDKLPPVRKIEQLGNGTVYLHLINHLHPGSVKLDRVILNANTLHQINQNLKMLASVFQKLEVDFKLEIDKLAQRKYQDNFYLASFLYRSAHEGDQNKSVNQAKKQEATPLNPKKYKFIPPEKPAVVSLQKVDIPNNSLQVIENMHQTASNKKIVQIRTVLDDTAPNKEKLNKIANILNLNKNDTANNPSFLKTIAIKEHEPLQESYKRFMRASLYNKSKYLSRYQQKIKNQEFPDRPHPIDESEKLKQLLEQEKAERGPQDDLLMSTQKQRQIQVQKRQMGEVQMKAEEQNILRQVGNNGVELGNLMSQPQSLCKQQLLQEN